ncbi:hypothetical protein ACFLRC_04295, partial [Candidatus Altiarchaeota archaeon]
TVYAHTGDGEECTPGNGSSEEEFSIDDFEDYHNQEQIDKQWWEDDERDDPDAPCKDEDCVPNEWRDYVCDDPSKECYDPNVINQTLSGSESHNSLLVNYTFNQSNVLEFYTLESYFWNNPHNQQQYHVLDWQKYSTLYVELRAPTFASALDEVEFHAGALYRQAEVYCEGVPDSECYNYCACAPKSEAFICDGDGVPGNSEDTGIPVSCLAEVASGVCRCSDIYWFEEGDIDGKTRILYLPPNETQDTIQKYEWSFGNMDDGGQVYNTRQIIGIILRFRETSNTSDPDTRVYDDSIYLDELMVRPYA